MNEDLWCNFMLLKINRNSCNLLYQNNLCLPMPPYFKKLIICTYIIWQMIYFAQNENWSTTTYLTNMPCHIFWFNSYTTMSIFISLVLIMFAAGRKLSLNVGMFFQTVVKGGLDNKPIYELVYLWVKWICFKESHFFL